MVENSSPKAHAPQPSKPPSRIRKWFEDHRVWRSIELLDIIGVFIYIVVLILSIHRRGFEMIKQEFYQNLNIQYLDHISIICAAIFIILLLEFHLSIGNIRNTHKNWGNLFIIGVVFLSISCLFFSIIGFSDFSNEHIVPLIIPSQTPTITSTPTSTPTATSTFTLNATNTPTMEEEIEQAITDYYSYLSNQDITNALEILTLRYRGIVSGLGIANDWKNRKAEILGFKDYQPNVNFINKSDAYITAHVYYVYSSGPVEEYNVRFYMKLEFEKWKIDYYVENLVS